MSPCKCYLRTSWTQFFRLRMPAQAKANNLMLEDVPPELSDLNEMEINAMKMAMHSMMKMTMNMHE